MSQKFIHPSQIQKITTEKSNSSSLEEILNGVKAGKKFIPVKGTILDRHIPDGYSLVEKQFGSQKFSILLPNKLVYFVSHPGEGGNPIEALNSVSEFYNEVREFENGLISEGTTNVLESNWAVRAEESYQTYLINYFVSGKMKEGDLMPEYSASILKELNIVPLSETQDIMAMVASICLGVKQENIVVNSLDKLLKHVTISEEKTLSGAATSVMACYMGSHWELKPEYKFNPATGAEREMPRYYSSRSCPPQIIEKGESYVALPKVNELLDTLVSRVMHTVNPKIVPHLKNIYSMYINLSLIGENNSHVWLPTEPPRLSKEI